MKYDEELKCVLASRGSNKCSSSMDAGMGIASSCTLTTRLFDFSCQTLPCQDTCHVKTEKFAFEMRHGNASRVNVGAHYMANWMPCGHTVYSFLAFWC
eukprot:4670453-Amphidinium_carterae.1